MQLSIVDTRPPFLVKTPQIRTTCILALLVLLPCAAFAQQPAAPAAWHILNLHQHPWFVDVGVASLVGWVIGMVKGFSGTKDWFERYWTNPHPLAIWVLDAIVFVGVGAYFGTGIYDPQSFLASIAAGFTWPIGLGSLTTKQE